MKPFSKRISWTLCLVGTGILTLSLAAASVVTYGKLPLSEPLRRCWEALTVLLGCGCFAAAATYRTYARQKENSGQVLYAMKLTGCIFAWFLIIQLTLRCF